MIPGAQAAPSRLTPFRAIAGWCLGGIALAVTPPMVGEVGELQGTYVVDEALTELRQANPIERQLSMGEEHRFRLVVPEEGHWLLRIDQVGVDVALTLRSDGGTSERFDSPLDRDGVEWLLLPAGGGEVEVHLEPLSHRPAGTYRLRVDRVRPEGPLEAFRHWTQGAAAYAAGGGEGQRRALADFRRAGEGWQDHRRPRHAAQALYAVAVLHRLLGEVTEARDEANRVLPLWRSFGDLGREADTLNEIGLLELRAGRPDAARQRFQEALAIQEQLGDGLRRSPTANNLCLTHLYEGEHAPAVECYGQVLATIRRIGDSEHEAVALTNLGWAHSNLGQPAEALASYRHAAQLHRQSGRVKRQAETLNALAVLHRNLGEPDEALRLYLQALDIFQRVGDRGWESRVLHNLGTVYQRLGDRQRARVFLQRALDLRQQLGDRPGEATGWRVLGLLELEERDSAAALEALGKSLDLELATDDRHGAAVARSLLGLALTEQGAWNRALDAVRQAQVDLEELGDSRYQARNLLTQGRILLALGRLEEATASLDRAVVEFEALGMANGASEAWVSMAEVQRREGDLEGALDRVDRGLALLDALRGEVGSPDLQSLFLGSRHEAHRLRIELLMTLAESSGDPRRVEEALLTSERWRAVGLRGLLGQVGERVRDGGAVPSEALRNARRAVRLQTSRLRRARARSEDGDPRASSEARRLEVELSRSMARVESLEVEGREGQRHSRDLPPFDMAGLRGALDAETALLEVVLGRERGFVFVVARGGLEVFEIPSREVMEGLAQQLHENLVAGRSPGEALAKLAHHLVEPALPRLATLQGGVPGIAIRRLAIVADGALHYVPFGVLPTPQPGQLGKPRPLLERYEIVYLASVSALVAERRRAAGRSPAPLWAAVLADPVFDVEDRRLNQADVASDAPTEGDGWVPPSEALPTLRQGLGVEFPRLRRSRQEAQQVAALAEPGEVLVALDFDANRELVLGGTLANYRVIHFATHGVIDSRNPALSGLALSLVDPEGSRVDGFLGLRDLYGMELQADLVVLSACQTALGREVRGEGLVGFTQAFLQAGARRVVASLWSVPDHATAELMGRFYGALADRPDDPAGALRQAQLSMAEERRWRDPRNWAAWILVGDWRPHPSADSAKR